MTEASGEGPAVRTIDLSQVLERLELGVGKAAPLCGISPRQLAYWTDAGYIQCKGDPGSRVYGWASLEKVCLIKQAQEKGYYLQQAVKLAELFLERRARKRAELEGASVEALQRLIMARTDRLKGLARRLRGGLGAFLVGGDKRRRAASTAVIAFLESNPYQVFTARQIGRRLERSIDLVKEELQLLTKRRFVLEIHYTGADVYRYIPPRRAV